MTEKNDYQKDLMIDPDILDILWTRHPHIYLKYSEASADANDLVRRKKSALEVLSAKLDQEIRISSEGESKKMTADAIKSAILIDERYISALVEYNDSLYKADILSSAVKALDHKKTALQNLVQLCLSGYFALPKIPRDLKSELKKIDKAEEEKIQEQKTEVQERAGRRIRNKEEVN